MEWYNDCEYKCDNCGVVFKCYFADDEGSTEFCPNCTRRNIEPIEEEEE